MTEPWYNSAHEIEHQGHTLVYQRGNAVLSRMHDSWIGVGPMDGLSCRSTA